MHVLGRGNTSSLNGELGTLAMLDNEDEFSEEAKVLVAGGVFWAWGSGSVRRIVANMHLNLFELVGLPKPQPSEKGALSDPVHGVLFWSLSDALELSDAG